MNTDGRLGIGEVQDLTGATRRTLQYYDRIGLLPAARAPGGRRTYSPADVTRLQFIQMLTSLGLPLATVERVVHAPGSGTDLGILRRQRSVLELEEMRLRTRRTVIDAIVRALESAPGATITAGALPALVDTDTALAGYADDDTETLDDTAVEFVVDVYLRWKAVSVQALVLAENDVDPSSAAGVEVGARWQAYLDAVGQGVVEESAFEEGRAAAEHWPAADRNLLERTEQYLHQCHQAYLRSRT